MRKYFGRLLAACVAVFVLATGTTAAQANPPVPAVQMKAVPVSGNIGVWMHNVPAGIRIAAVTPNSPAEFAGLEVGDIIVNVDGFAIWCVDDLEAAKRASNGVIRCRVIDVRGTGIVFRNIPLN